MNKSFWAESPTLYKFAAAARCIRLTRLGNPTEKIALRPMDQDKNPLAGCICKIAGVSFEVARKFKSSNVRHCF